MLFVEDLLLPNEHLNNIKFQTNSQLSRLFSFFTYTAEELRTHYVCNECGVATASLDKLQV